MRGNTQPPYCGECPFLRYESTDGYGLCYTNRRIVCCSDQCHIAYETLKPAQALRVLHFHQKWRRGGKGAMAPPYLVGAAIDTAIHQLRKLLKQSKQ